jgi:hypothetical protein
MAATPPKELVKPIWRGLATPLQYRRYLNESAVLVVRVAVCGDGQ